MKSSMLILFAAALFYSVESFEAPEPSEGGDKEDGEFEPRFMAVFLEMEGDDWNDTNSEPGTNVSLDGSAIKDVLPKIRTGSVEQVQGILNNMSAVDKFEHVMSQLGIGNSTQEVGSGSTSEETEKFKKILTTLEHSNLSNKTLAEVNNILTKIESGDNFAMYRL